MPEQKNTVLPPVFSEALALRPGDVASLVGCGGKTSLLYRLAKENREKKVLLTTTTKIRRPNPPDIDRVLRRGELPLAGINLVYGSGDVKIGGLPEEELRAFVPSDGLTLIESDGSRNLPLKGWEEYEPVVPACTTLTVGVCTLWPVGLPSSEEIVHRPNLFARLTGAVDGDMITVEHIVAMLMGKGGMFEKGKGRRVVFVNQVESPAAMELAERLAGLLPGLRVIAGSLWQGDAQVLQEGE